MGCEAILPESVALSHPCHLRCLHAFTPSQIRTVYASQILSLQHLRTQIPTGLTQLTRVGPDHKPRGALKNGMGGLATVARQTRFGKPERAEFGNHRSNQKPNVGSALSPSPKNPEP